VHQAAIVTHQEALNAMEAAEQNMNALTDKATSRGLCSYNGSVFCSLALKGRIVGWGVLWHRLQVLEAQLHP